MRPLIFDRVLRRLPLPSPHLLLPCLLLGAAAAHGGASGRARGDAPAHPLRSASASALELTGFPGDRTSVRR